MRKTGRRLLASDAAERGSFLHTDRVQRPARLRLPRRAGRRRGRRNWITPAAEMEELYFPQKDWILDAIHERILPLPGHAPDGADARRARAPRERRECRAHGGRHRRGRGAPCRGERPGKDARRAPRCPREARRGTAAAASADGRVQQPCAHDLQLQPLLALDGRLPRARGGARGRRLRRPRLDIRLARDGRGLRFGGHRRGYRLRAPRGLPRLARRGRSFRRPQDQQP